MPTEEATNYTGKGGKAPIIKQGQTSGSYGNDPHVTSRVKGATPLEKK